MMSGVVLLGEIAARLPVLDVACNRCDRRGRLRTDRLLAEHGAGMPIPALLRIIAGNCPRQGTERVYDLCGIHLPDLSRSAAERGVDIFTAREHPEIAKPGRSRPRTGTQQSVLTRRLVYRRVAFLPRER
jgi:hypothetical protein